MSREAVCCAGCLLFLFLDCTWAAPLSRSSKLTSFFEDQASRTRRSAPQVDEQENDSFFDLNNRFERSTNVDNGAELYIELQNNQQLSDSFAKLDTHARERRHAQESSLNDEEELYKRVMQFGDEDSVKPRERRRRSIGAFFLHAAVELCDTRPEVCGKIHYADRDVSMSISRPSQNRVSAPSRMKRRVVKQDDERAIVESVLRFGDDGTLTKKERRQRRSAAFMLQAAIEMCNRRRSMCGRIHITEHDFNVNFRVSDE